MIGRHYSWLLDPGGQIVAVFDRHAQPVRATWTAGRHSAIAPSRRSTSERWWSMSGKPIHDEKGELVGWRGVASDITEARLSGNDAVRAARTDPLTGLANRLLVRELLEEAVMRQWDSDARLRAAAGRSRPLQAGQRYAGPCDRRPVAGRSRPAAGSVGRRAAAGSAGSAATSSPSCGAAAATADRLSASPSGSSPTCRRASPSAPRPSMSARRSASRSVPPDGDVRGAADAQRRPGAVPRQGSRPRRPCLLRALHVRRGRGSSPARAGRPPGA